MRLAPPALLPGTESTEVMAPAASMLQRCSGIWLSPQVQSCFVRKRRRSCANIATIAFARRRRCGRCSEGFSRAHTAEIRYIQ